MLSQRECSILGILHETDGFITAEAISGRLAVSPKTVRNDLTEIKGGGTGEGFPA
ncbi:MAG: HTH domain-containing protein [Ruminococcaceae bacterium]|jgi:transcriptional antiterminator|nr:HTH domain-containing protein [Oscillospiraceae bacterium]